VIKQSKQLEKRLEKYNAVKEPTEHESWVLGCMVERLKEKFLTKIADMVVDQMSYLPNLLAEVEEGRAIKRILSKEENYGDISPVRLMSNGITALVSIRGCDNVYVLCCTFTRGRERSRTKSIIAEIQDFGTKVLRKLRFWVRMLTDSYLWYGGGLKKDFRMRVKCKSNFGRF
jgi:tRNA-2-methylthio-N6-dimethylallyladenosine synthase